MRNEQPTFSLKQPSTEKAKTRITLPKKEIGIGNVPAYAATVKCFGEGHKRKLIQKVNQKGEYVPDAFRKCWDKYFLHILSRGSYSFGHIQDLKFKNGTLSTND